MGKAVREHNMPRDAIVIMTKVRPLLPAILLLLKIKTKVLNPFTRQYSEHLHGNMRTNADEAGYANQHGLSRKVS